MVSISCACGETHFEVWFFAVLFIFMDFHGVVLNWLKKSIHIFLKRLLSKGISVWIIQTLSLSCTPVGVIFLLMLRLV